MAQTFGLPAENTMPATKLWESTKTNATRIFLCECKMLAETRNVRFDAELLRDGCISERFDSEITRSGSHKRLQERAAGKTFRVANPLDRQTCAKMGFPYLLVSLRIFRITRTPTYFVHVAVITVNSDMGLGL